MCAAWALLLTGAWACAPVPSAPDDQPPGGYVPHAAPAMPTSSVPEPAMPMLWWQDTTLNLPLYDEAQLDAIARHAVAKFPLRQLLSPEGAPVVAQLRARNPNIVIIGGLEVLSFVDVWNQPSHRARFPLSTQLYDLLAPYAAHRTDGEVATMWTGAPMVNPYLPGNAFNLSLLRRFMDVICDHAMRYPGAFDGVFHDYTSPNPYLYPQPADPAIQADLDGDGVGALTDPDDKAAWVAWQHALVDEWQARFGPGLIQIANGYLPHADADFARKLAGIHFERFPTTPWGYTDLVAMDLLVQRLQPGYLTPRRGRVWCQLLAAHSWDRDLCRLGSMLTGAGYSCWNEDATPLVDPITIDCGLPLAPMVRAVQPDGTVRFSRSFERGQVVVEMWAASGATKSATFVTD